MKALDRSPNLSHVSVRIGTSKVDSTPRVKHPVNSSIAEQIIFAAHPRLADPKAADVLPQNRTRRRLHTIGTRLPTKYKTLFVSTRYFCPSSLECWPCSNGCKRTFSSVSTKQSTALKLSVRTWNRLLELPTVLTDKHKDPDSRNRYVLVPIDQRTNTVEKKLYWLFYSAEKDGALPSCVSYREKKTLTKQLYY